MCGALYYLIGDFWKKAMYFSTLSFMYIPFYHTNPISCRIAGVTGIPISPGRFFISEE